MQESDSDSDGEEIIMYRCRHCPNQEFTADEREGHRQAHIEMRLLKLKQTRVRQQMEKIKNIKCWGIPLRESSVISKSIARMLPNLNDVPESTATASSSSHQQHPGESLRTVRANAKSTKHIAKKTSTSSSR